MQVWADRSDNDLDRLGYVVLDFVGTAVLNDLASSYWSRGPAPGDPQTGTFTDFESSSLEYRHATACHLREHLEPCIRKVLHGHDIYYAEFVITWPNSVGTAPHQDLTVVDESEYRSLSIWFPVDQAPNLLWVVPGSHRFIPSIRMDANRRFIYRDALQDILDHHGKAVVVHPGEAVVFDSRLIHFTRPNPSSHARLAVLVGVRPSNAPLLHYRSAGDGWCDVYAISDRFFLEQSPASLQGRPLPYEVVDRVRFATPSINAEEFAEMCHRTSTDSL